jgi:hypothetical protein
MERLKWPAETVRQIDNYDATLAGMRDGLAWLVADARPGDVRLMFYAGHGTHVADRSGDEAEDQQDECLVTVDHVWDRPLLDDEIKSYIDRLPRGAHLVAIMDCCYSGTILRAWTDYRIRYLPCPVEEERKIKAAKARAKEAFQTYLRGEMQKWRASMSDAELEARLGELADRAYTTFVKGKTYEFVDVTGDHVLISATSPQQEAEEATIEGQVRGVLTYHLLKVLGEEGEALTYRSWIEKASRYMQPWAQTPQLECRPELATHLLFAPIPSP